VIVVSDASPIISLSAVGHLDLLRLLYEQISIPDSVRQEILRANSARPGVAELKAADWIVTHSVEYSHLVRTLDGDLDRGEAEAIALAVNLRAEMVLMDERRGRVIADRFGLRVVGVLGILVEAKARGFLPAVGPVMDALLTVANFRVGPTLYLHVLRAAEEWPPTGDR
jgi:uncharacterized protein